METRLTSISYPYGWVEKIDMPDLPPKYNPTGVGTHQSDDETNDPLIADHRNFYKVEKWTKDGSKFDHMLYAGGKLDKAREVFAGGDQASAPDPANHPAADEGARAVAGVGSISRDLLTLPYQESEQ